jgi:putative DNA primase/helicase
MMNENIDNGSNQNEPMNDEIEQQPLEAETSTESRSEGTVIKAILGEDQFLLNDKGVFQVEITDGRVKFNTLVCSPLRIVADSRDENGQNWGRILEFHDRDGNLQRYLMPMQELKRDGEAVVEVLLSKGLSLYPGKAARNRLIDYVQNSQPEKDTRVRSTDKTGWCGKRFILSNEVIGPGVEEIVCTSTSASLRSFSRNGSQDDWTQNVARLCIGNSRLIFAASCAFASAMLLPLVEESGGFNFVGASSTGKSTALHVAASVFGKPEIFIQSWRATSNGLEGIAKGHNDTLLILDELGQVQPKEAGEVAYMLANGAGKLRANIHGQARQKSSWRLLYLSSGEITLADHMIDGGKKAKAGQAVRLADIPADAGCNMGIFEVLNGIDTPSNLAETLKMNCAQHYGTAFPRFIESVIDDYDGVIEDVKMYRDEFQQRNAHEGASSQVHRVLNRFATVAAAGEMATVLGITGWAPGDASEAAKRCFDSWLSARGGAGMQEVTALLAQVRAFFEANGESRFSLKGVKDQRVIHNRAGIREIIDGVTEYGVFPQAFSEICAGFDRKWAAKVLVEKGIIIPASEKKYQKTLRVADLGPVKVYHITSKVLE